MNAQAETDKVYLVRKRVEPGKKRFLYWLSFSDGQLASFPYKTQNAVIAIAVKNNRKIADFCTMNYFDEHYFKPTA